MESLIQSAIATKQKAVYGTGDKSLEDYNWPSRARILAIGCGGMGSNAINRLSSIGVHGAETIALNTDAQHLKMVKADRKVLIGEELTKGLGAGGYVEVGKHAAEETINEIREVLRGTDLVYVVAGMGGGTGTGAAPVVAEIAKGQGAIVVGVVSMPFKIEGARINKAEEGLARLRNVCDTVIVIENDRLIEVAGSMPLQQAFAVADEIIVTMIKGITETIATPSLVNLDFADVRAIMKSGGVAVIGVGESSSAARAREAAEKALSAPLLDVEYTGATGALVHITGASDMKLEEVGEIGEFVARHLDAGAQTIWGARIDENMAGKIRVIAIITGVKSQYVLGPQPLEKAKVKDVSQALGIPIIR